MNWRDDHDCGCGGHDHHSGGWWDGDDGHDHHDWHGDHGHHDHHGRDRYDHRDGHHRHHHRPGGHRRLIPIGSVTVDCTPVTFRTPGQAINVVSCPVSWVIPGTRCIATIHTPPVQTPVLPIFERRKTCGCH